MPKNCNKIFVRRCNEEIWNGESILDSHVRGQDIILQKITMQISKATSAIITDSGLNMKESGLQGVSANAYQAPVKWLDHMHCWFFVYFNKILYWFESVQKRQHEGSVSTFLRKFANNVPPGSALLFGDDLAVRIKSLKNNTSLMKPVKMMNKRDSVKTKKKFPALLRKLCLRKKRVASPEELILLSLWNWAKSVPEAKRTKNTGKLSRSLFCLWFVTKR